jgi:hypothetical protein
MGRSQCGSKTFKVIRAAPAPPLVFRRHTAFLRELEAVSVGTAGNLKADAEKEHSLERAEDPKGNAWHTAGGWASATESLLGGPETYDSVTQQESRDHVKVA